MCVCVCVYIYIYIKCVCREKEKKRERREREKKKRGGGGRERVSKLTLCLSRLFILFYSSYQNIFFVKMEFIFLAIDEIFPTLPRLTPSPTQAPVLPSPLL